jgi:predicted  nucleic acid-binding Zn-ribbon protein
VDKVLDVLGTASGPSTIVGIILTIFFYLRKQESGIRADINGSLQRLQTENENLRQEIEEKEATIDELRKERRAAEDREDQQRRRAEVAEDDLKNMGH